MDAIERIVKNIETAKCYEFGAITIDASGVFVSINWKLIIDNVVRANIDLTYVKICQSILIKRIVEYDNNYYETERDYYNLFII